MYIDIRGETVTQTNPNNGGHGGRIVKLVIAGGIAGCVLSLISKYAPAAHPAAGPVGTAIAFVVGALFGRLAGSWGWAAGGSAIVGGLSALIGIFVGWLLKDQPASVLAFGTLGGFIAGAVGGLIMHGIGQRRATPSR